MAACVDSIEIGDTTHNTTAVYIYFKLIATGRVIRLSATTSAAGLVTADTSDVTFVPGQAYEIWVTLASGDPNCRLDVYPKDCDGDVSATAYTCFSAKFFSVYNDDPAMVYYTSQTLRV